MSNTDRTRQLCDELRSDTCRCGRPKQTKHTFCSKCFCDLPPALKSGLYARMGSGYEEARGASVRYLEGQDAQAH